MQKLLKLLKLNTRSDPAILGPAEEEIMNLLAARIQGIRDQVRRNAATTNLTP